MANSVMSLPPNTDRRLQSREDLEQELTESQRKVQFLQQLCLGHHRLVEVQMKKVDLLEKQVEKADQTNQELCQQIVSLTEKVTKLQEKLDHPEPSLLKQLHDWLYPDATL